MCVHYAAYIVRVQVFFSRMTGSASKVNIVKCSGWRSSSTDSHPSLLVLSLDFTRRVCSPCWLHAWLIVDSLLLLCLQRLKHSYFSYRCTYIKITSILKITSHTAMSYKETLIIANASSYTHLMCRHPLTPQVCTASVHQHSGKSNCYLIQSIFLTV